MNPQPNPPAVVPSAEDYQAARALDYNVFAETMTGRGGAWADHRESFNNGYAHAHAVFAAYTAALTARVRELEGGDVDTLLKRVEEFRAQIARDRSAPTNQQLASRIATLEAELKAADEECYAICDALECSRAHDEFHPVDCVNDLKHANAKLKQQLATLTALGHQHREMRTLLLRIHSARVGMNETAVIAALNDVDSFFREPNTN